jgi:hypothetical protein
VRYQCEYNPWKLSGLTYCLGLALFTYGNEMVSSANRDDREVKILKYIYSRTEQGSQNDTFVLFKEVIFTVWFKNKNLNLKQCDPEP